MKVSYRRMSASQLSEGMDQIGLSASGLARLIGSRYSRVKGWLEGTESVPHYVALAMTLMTIPGAVPLAEKLCAHLEISREPEDGEPIDKDDRGGAASSS